MLDQTGTNKKGTLVFLLGLIAPTLAVAGIVAVSQKTPPQTLLRPGSPPSSAPMSGGIGGGSDCNWESLYNNIGGGYNTSEAAIAADPIAASQVPPLVKEIIDTETALFKNTTTKFWVTKLDSGKWVIHRAEKISSCSISPFTNLPAGGPNPLLFIPDPSPSADPGD